MNKIMAIFFTIVFITIGSFGILWATNPKNEREQAQATQGIRLVGSAVYYNNPDAPEKNLIRVGDLLIGNNEQVFRINEIRKSQDNTIFVVVSWKYITAYKTYAEYQSQPYSNYKTYELNAFAYNKSVIPKDELEDFYTEFSDQIVKIKAEQQAPPSPLAQAPSPVASASAPMANKTPEPEPVTTANTVAEVTARPQAYSTDEVSVPEQTIDEEELDKLKDLDKEIKE